VSGGQGEEVCKPTPTEYTCFPRVLCDCVLHVLDVHDNSPWRWMPYVDDDDYVDGGETTSLNCYRQQAYCPSPRWHVSVEKHGRMISTGENCWFVRQSSLTILLAVNSSKAGGTSKENYECYLTKYLLYFEVLTCSKNTSTWGRRL
jgi:hypothetical protein